MKRVLSKFLFIQIHRTLEEFVQPRRLEAVLAVFPPDTPLSLFCSIDPNAVQVEDEILREKVMMAIHAARAYLVAQMEVRSSEHLFSYSRNLV